MMDNLTLPFFLFVQEALILLGGSAQLCAQIVREIFPLQTKLLAEQIYQVGVRSFWLIFITAFSTGMVMSLQFGLGLEKFGGKLYVPKLVALSIVREMGPVFTSLMLAARVGAGMASEIGSMVVTQQIDAIRALGTSPIQKIVVPRVLACLLVVPLLGAIANLAGIVGGTIVGATELGLDPQFYILKVLSTVKLAAYISGIAKTVFFALAIAIPACYFGLNVKDGTRGVGSATTRAVVVSSILILVGNFFLTKAFWIIEKWK